MPFVLNEAQMRRIENVHGGFLYQHLYTVALLLSRPGLDWTEIAVERDEDIEVQLAQHRLYLQVKKRGENLTFGDIADVLERFQDISREHETGQRPGNPVCWIISNAEPGPDLSKRIKADWPADVYLRTPRTCTGDRATLPVPGQSLESMWEVCVRLARKLPHATLQPETLVWKLAALVQYLAAGAMRPDHVLASTDLLPLLEQLVAQLQSLPEPLDDYARDLKSSERNHCLSVSGIGLNIGQRLSEVFRNPTIPVQSMSYEARYIFHEVVCKGSG